jgi:hypothetical protein
VADPIDKLRLAGLVEQVIGRMEHPKAPSLSVADYRATERAAAMMKNPDEAAPQDVVDLYHQLKHIGMAAARSVAR